MSAVRLAALAVSVLIVAVVACGGTTAETPSSTGTAPEDPPDAVVAELVAALAADRIDDTAGLVDEEQLALLTFLDGTAGGEVAAMIDGGVPDGVRRAFWTTFSRSVTDMSGEPIGRLTVSGTRPLSPEHVAVDTVIGATERSSTWVVRATDRGWVVDLLATFGGVFAPNLWAWSELLPPGEARDAVLDMIARHSSSLELARSLGEGRLPAEALDALLLLEGRS